MKTLLELFGWRNKTGNEVSRATLQIPRDKRDKPVLYIFARRDVGKGPVGPTEGAGWFDLEQGDMSEVAKHLESLLPVLRQEKPPDEPKYSVNILFLPPVNTGRTELQWNITDRKEELPHVLGHLSDCLNSQGYPAQAQQLAAVAVNKPQPLLPGLPRGR